MGAFLLQTGKDSLLINVRLVGMLIIVCSLSLYLIYPSITQGYTGKITQTRKITNYINEHQTNSERPTIFFDIHNEEIKWHHGFYFGVKEETRGYIFSIAENFDISNLLNEVDSGFYMLSQFGKYDFDSTYTYFVTDQEDPLTSMKVLDSMNLGNVHFYKVGL